MSHVIFFLHQSWHEIYFIDDWGRKWKILRNSTYNSFCSVLFYTRETHVAEALSEFFFWIFRSGIKFLWLLCDCRVTVVWLLCHCSLTIVSLQFDCCVTVASLSRNCRATVVGKTIICRNIFAFWLSPSVARENKNSQRER